jgi:UDP-galactopyranose mutase
VLLKVDNIEKMCIKTLRLVSLSHSYRAKDLPYFPVKSTKDMQTLQAVLEKNQKEKEKIVRHLNVK